MSRRYGRNQRRQHRARIAELEQLLYGGAAAPPHWPCLEDLRLVSARVEQDILPSRRQETTVSLCVEVWPGDMERLQALLGQAYASFQGRPLLLDVPVFERAYEHGPVSTPLVTLVGRQVRL